MPGLDGIRALAILLVVCHHLNLLGVGWIGVQLFFVLSGFLITRLLLGLRDGRALPSYLKTFHGRRALRIFPVYYLYLVLLLAALPWLAPVQREAVGGQWAYAATYLANWRGMTQFHQSTYFLDHFWSLAIEEQFYLVWPLLVFLLPRTLLPRVLLALVLAGPALRYAVFQLWPQFDVADRGALPYAVAVCTLSQLDAFALGALLCFGGERVARLRRPAAWLAAALLLAFGLGAAAAGPGIAPLREFGAWLTLGYPNTLPAHYQFVWGYSVINAVAALLIGLATFARFGARLLAHPAVAYLGRISYGVYIFHFPLAHLTSGAVYRIHQWTGANLYLCLLLYAPLYLATLLTLAALSYEAYEKFFLRLKDRAFPA